MDVVSDPSSASTARFAARREHILAVGARLMNEHGLKGLSLGAVAEEIGIGGSSVTYYFRRKDLLAEACFDRSLDALEQRVSEAAEAESAEERIRGLVHLTVRSLEGLDQGGLARMHEMRAMDDPGRARLLQRYFAIFRRARGFFDQSSGDAAHLLQIMRTQILLETVHSLPDWLLRYAPQEHERVAERLVLLLTRGLVPPAKAPATSPALAVAETEKDAAQERFLGAATVLMNQRGYRGASVERIAAALKVTKGSFYHHLGAKDDLVLACFRRSLDVIGRAQDAALAGPGSHLDRLATALAALIAVQFGEGTPLLRSTALEALPPELKREAVDRSEQMARRFAGMIIDGIAEGSIAPVDPLIAGQLIMSSLNTAFELRDLSRQLSPDQAVALYASTLLKGLIAP